MKSLLPTFITDNFTNHRAGIHSLRSLQASFDLLPSPPPRRSWRSQLFHRKPISTKQVLDDLVALLQSLAAAIRSGMDPIMALERSGESLGESSYLSQEVSRLILRITDESIPLETALKEFANDIQDPCLDLFRHALKLAHDDGASISTCLQRLSRVTRQRQSFDRKVKSALAMQKLSTIGLLACAGIMLTTQALTNLEAITRTFSNPLSLSVMIFGLTLLISGGLMMSMLARRVFA